jgi:DNA-binding NarL/FixJ family response regulator
MDKCIRICVVDRHPLYRDGIVLALNSQPDIEVTDQGATAWDAVRIVQERDPDVIVLDACTLGRSMEVIETILRQNPKIGIVVLAEMADEESVYAALRRGVRGYLLKGTNRAELVQTLRVLSQGQSFISPSLAAKLLMRSGPPAIAENKPAGGLPHLTPREQQILSILVQGRSNKEIGNRLDLSEKTIKHHLTNILQKLRVRNRVEAALMASSCLPQHPTLS